MQFKYSPTMKVINVYIVVVLVIEGAKCRMTEAQIKSAGRLLRNVCQPKLKVTNGQIEDMHSGEFPENRDLMCYAECILRMGQVMKDGKLMEDNIHSQMANLPPSIAENALAALNKCKNIKSNEKCAAAFEFYKCFYEFNPSGFYLP